MKELIKKALKKYPDANLTSDAALDVISDSIMDSLQPLFDFKIPTNENEEAQIALLRATYTPVILNLIRSVGTQLSGEKEVETIFGVYNQIIELAKTKNNGTMLLAIIQATITLLGSATAQVQEMDNLVASVPAEPDEDPKVTEVAVAGV